MNNLVMFMLEKVGIIFIVAYLLTRIKAFRYIVQHEQKMHEKFMLILLFGAFGIISNFTGIEINHNTVAPSHWFLHLEPESALANTRVMGVVIGGLLGGPVVGIGSGMIAGIHRYSLGGFTAFSCTVSTMFAGIVAGYLGGERKRKGKKVTAKFAFITGIMLESIQMVIILVTAKPFEEALNLVQLISFPMILVNGFGTLLFMFIFQSIMKDDVQARANQTNLAFKIADLTLPYFRQGLNRQSCKEISNIILKWTSADAVAITDVHHVLSHVGAGSDHHIPLQKPITGLTIHVLKTGKITVATNKNDIYCSHSTCPLEAAIVLPLKIKNKVIGTLKMYYTDPEKLDEVQQQLAEGLANLFCAQLELAEADRQTKLLKEAEIKALQAQIHPHFLFNSLNTISSLCRIDPDQARNLLLQLSSFFRSNLQGARQMLIPLEKELENVHAYLALERTRFPNKYDITFEIQPDIEKTLIPPFILQPIVENAIHYGFPKSKDRGTIAIKIFSKKNHLYIMVKDNGKGIPKDKITILGQQVVESNKGNGTAIYNINQRLKGIYSGSAVFRIDSKLDKGTLVTILIPLGSKGVFEGYVESVHSG